MNELERIAAESERLRCEIAAQVHKLVWTKEPITRTPFDQLSARDASAASAWNDGGQDLHRVIG